MRLLEPLKRVSPRLTFLVELPGEGGQLVAAGLWSLALRGAGMAATLVLGIQLARYLGPSDLGIYGLIIALTMLLSAVGQLGLPTLATREVAIAWTRRDYSGLRGVLRWFGLASLATSALLALMLVLFAKLWPGLDPRLDASFAIGALLVPLFTLTVLISAELRALDRLVLGQSLEILVRPLASCILLATTFLLLRRIDAQLALGVTVASSALALLLAWLWLTRALPPVARVARPDRQLRKWAKSARPLAITDVLRQLDGSYAILLMGLLTTTYQTGIFRVAQSTMLAMAIPVFVVQVIVAPALARLHESGDRVKLQRLLGSSAVATLAGGLVGLAVIVALGPGFLGFVFGREYGASWLPLVILSLTQVVSGFFGVGFVLLPMAKAERELTISFAASVAISLLSAVPLTTYWGANGAAAAAVVGAFTNGLLTRHFALSRIGVETSLVGWFLMEKR